MPNPIAVIAAGSIVSAGAGLIGANKAAKASQQATEATTGEAARQFDIVRSDTAKQRALGERATDTLARLYGYGPLTNPSATTPASSDPFAGRDYLDFTLPFSGASIRVPRQISAPSTAPPAASTAPSGSPDMSVFFASPDYQFNLAEGQKAIDRSAAARGGLLSGAAVREGTRYASGLASREYASFVDRLMQQAGLGSTGIGQSAAAGANTVNAVAGANAANAATRGSAYLTGANAVNSAFQGGINNWLLSKYLATGTG